MAAPGPTGLHWRKTDQRALAEALIRNIYGGVRVGPVRLRALRPICGRSRRI